MLDLNSYAESFEMMGALEQAEIRFARLRLCVPPHSVSEHTIIHNF